jgi:tape measure domain-containing protein
MAKLIINVSNQGIEQTKQKIQELRDELQRVSGIKYDGTNAKSIADKILADEQALQRKRIVADEEFNRKKTLLAEQNAAKDKLQADKLAAQDAALKAKLETQNAIANAKLAQQNEQFRTREQRLTENASNSLFAKFGNIRNVLGSIVQAASIAGAGIASAFSIGAFVNVNKELDTLKVRIEGLFDGNPEGLKRFNDSIAEVAKTSSLPLQDLTETAIRLQTLGLEPTIETMRALTDVTAKVGGGTDVLNGVVTALTQSLNKGKIQQEELNQLAERGIPAQRLLAEAMGISGQELEKLQKRGELGKKEINLLIEAIGKFSAGSSARQIDTLGGAMNRFKDSTTQALRSISEGGAGKALTDLINRISGGIKALADDGSLNRWSANVISTVSAASNAFNAFGVTIGESAAKIGLLVQDQVDTGTFDPLINAANKLKTASDLFATDIANKLGIEIPNAADTATNSLTATGAAMDGLSESADGADKVVNNLTGATVALNKAAEQINLDLGLTKLKTDAEKAEIALLNIKEGATKAFDSIKKLQDGGETGALTLREAIARVSDVELARLKESFAAAKDTGVLSFKDIQAAVDAVNLESLEREFKKLGVTSSTELNRIASESKAAFDAIAASGSNIRDLARAFEVYAAKALEARMAVSDNTDVLEAQLKAEAAQNKLNLSIDETGKLAVTAYNQYKASTNSAILAVDELTASQIRVQRVIAATAAEAESAHRTELSLQQEKIDKERELSSEQRRRAGQLIQDFRGLSANELELERLQQIQAQSNPTGLRTGQEEKFRLALAEAQKRVDAEKRNASDQQAQDSKDRELKRLQQEQEIARLRGEQKAELTVNLDGKQLFSSANKARLVKK